MQTPKFKAQPTNALFTTVNLKCSAARPSIRLCRARDNQIEHSSENETVLFSSRKLVGAAEHLINLAKNALVG